jgi:hypothetical protein
MGVSLFLIAALTVWKLGSRCDVVYAEYQSRIPSTEIIMR